MKARIIPRMRAILILITLGALFKNNLFFTKLDVVVELELVVEEVALTEKELTK